MKRHWMERKTKTYFKEKMKTAFEILGEKILGITQDLMLAREALCH